MNHFHHRDVVVTEKLDGESTTIYADGYVHARSIDGRGHVSQTWVRALAARVAHNIPEGWRICGENVYARHSISYDRLGTFFYVFGIYDENNMCLSWDRMMDWAEVLGFQTVPVLYRGEWDEPAVKSCYTGESRVGQESEGYVIRMADSFHYEDFSANVAKFVRANHVQTDIHWKSVPIVPNTLNSK